MSTIHAQKDKTKRTKHKSLLVALTAILVVAFGGMAFAYWTSTGSGTGAGTTGTSTAFTVTSTPQTTPALTPGGASQSVPFTVTNPGTGSLLLSSVVVTVANSDGTTWDAVPGCSAADYAVGTPVVTGGYGQIAGGANKAGTVSLTMNNLPSNQDACKDAVVPLYFVAS